MLETQQLEESFYRARFLDRNASVFCSTIVKNKVRAVEEKREVVLSLQQVQLLSCQYPASKGISICSGKYQDTESQKKSLEQEITTISETTFYEKTLYR